MNHQRDAKETLQSALERLGSPRLNEMESAGERVRQTLRAKALASPEKDVAVPPIDARRVTVWTLRQPYLVAAAAVLVVGLSITVFRFNSDRGLVVQSADGSVQRLSFGEPVLADGGALVSLPDGSSIEMRMQSELSLQRADDGVRIHLSKGSIIVTAAKQRTGHLYVQTKDVDVSVVGTVFLVNAGETGSRVAVIQGEVHVQQGTTPKKVLRPGDQVATGLLMEALPVTREISWSRNAALHLALLQQNTTLAVPTPPPVRLEFAAASIRPFAPGGRESIGFVCHGIDGNRHARFGVDQNPGFPAPQGRCVGNNVRLPQLIAYAYGLPPRFGPSVGEWARPYSSPTGPPDRSDKFQIDAVAEEPATATTEQLKQMLQTMLTERFKLKVRREMQEVPGYALVIAKNGSKLKEVSGDENLSIVDFSIPGQPRLKGRSRLDALIEFVMGFVNPTGFITSELPTTVIDKTGLTGMYEYELTLPIPGGGPRTQNPAPQGIPGDRASEMFAWRGPDLSTAMEEQLGLRLQPEKIRTEVLVVDQAGKPSPN